MSSSRTDEMALARDVRVTDNELTVDLADGRRLSVPLDWYPRLAAGSEREWTNWELIGNGYGIHWPDLDEDISVAGLLAGHRSNETAESIKDWLASRSRHHSRRMSRLTG
jgi:hypothetical protein